MVDASSAFSDIVSQISSAVIDATPNVLLAVVILLVSAIIIRVLTSIADNRIDSLVPDKRNAGIMKMGIKIVLWFSVMLVVMSVLGYQELATAIGTSSGFIAIGTSYAMKDAIQEVVAGFYLMKDESYVVGNRITVGSVTGEIMEIQLQRTRIRKDDDSVTTMSNQKIEPEWTLLKPVEETSTEVTSTEVTSTEETE